MQIKMDGLTFLVVSVGWPTVNLKGWSHWMVAKVLLPLPNGLHECAALSGCHKIGTEVLGTWSSAPHQLLLPVWDQFKHTKISKMTWESSIIFDSYDHCMSRVPFSRPPVPSLDPRPNIFQDLQPLQIQKKDLKWEIQTERILRYINLIQ